MMNKPRDDADAVGLEAKNISFQAANMNFRMQMLTTSIPQYKMPNTPNFEAVSGLQ